VSLLGFGNLACLVQVILNRRHFPNDGIMRILGGTIREIKPKRVIVIIVLCVLLTAILPPSRFFVSAVYVEEPTSDVFWPTGGWRNSTPEEQGMNSATLQNMRNHIINSNLDVHSVIVIRHGYVVLEEYPFPFQGQSRTMSVQGTHYLYSATKSFTSCLIGMAIDQGYFENTSQTVLSLFPDTTFSNVDDRKEQMTVWDLLTMRSGLPWDETSTSLNSPENDVFQVNFNSSGGVQYVLDRPMEYDPGTVFLYNTGASHVLSGIVQEVTDMTTLEFATEFLFTPLNISPVYWPSDAKGVNFGGYDLQLRPLDMAKFGYLYLHNGTWGTEQLLSTEWIRNTTTTITMLSPTHGYAAQWHTMPDLGVYYAAGLYGQYIFVSPEYDLVAVFTSGYGVNDIDENPQMFRDYIIASLSDVEIQGFDFLPVVIILAVSLPLVAVIIVFYRKTH
jgi:CubicO group peptidase (beta-lactamase class C family)